jgi:hypothetical protein
MVITTFPALWSQWTWTVPVLRWLEPIWVRPEIEGEVKGDVIAASEYSSTRDKRN